MKFAKIVTCIGIALLVFAWVSAAFIPNQARSDFDRLVRESGGSLSTPGEYVGTYQQMCANRRMLQNVYVGVAGLICVCTGLSCWKQHVKP